MTRDGDSYTLELKGTVPYVDLVNLAKNSCQGKDIVDMSFEDSEVPAAVATSDVCIERDKDFVADLRRSLWQRDLQVASVYRNEFNMLDWFVNVIGNRIGAFQKYLTYGNLVLCPSCVLLLCFI
jgi:hypothetical protein